MKKHWETSDYFIGRVSPFLLFEIEYHSLFDVVEKNKKMRFYTDVNPAAQVASIGILAYFEAFCKHQFAAIVNLFPELIHEFAKKRSDPKIAFSTILSFDGKFEQNIGFALAEEYDFGTAKSINGLFRDLLLVTPLNKSEENQLNEIIYTRNLCVHHGGYYTLQYLRKNSAREQEVQRPFTDSVKIDTEEFHEISEFLFMAAAKIARETIKAVKNMPAFVSLADSHPKREAVREMLQAMHDVLDE